MRRRKLHKLKFYKGPEKLVAWARRVKVQAMPKEWRQKPKRRRDRGCRLNKTLIMRRYK